VITAQACASARRLLEWSIKDLAEEAGMAPRTVRNLEGGLEVAERSRARVLAALRRHGVEISLDGRDARFRRFCG
jgi:DNA-binding LacI/PurR family transcriptional regulator